MFIGITLLYARLYVFLKRPDKIRSPYSNSPTGGSYDSSHPKRKIHGFLRKLSGGEKGSGSGAATPAMGPNHVAPYPPDANGITNEKLLSQQQGQDPTLHAEAFGRDNPPSMSPNDPIFSSTTFRPSSAPVSPATEVPPWERMELPVFHIDGQRYGGPSNSGANGSLGGATPAQQGIFGGWRGLTGKKRPSTANSSGSVTPAFGNTHGHASGHASPAAHNGQRTGSVSAALAPYEPGARSRQLSGDTTMTGDGRDRGSRKMSSVGTATTANTTTALLPSTSRRPSAVPPDTSPVPEQDSEKDVYPSDDARNSDAGRRGSEMRAVRERDRDEVDVGRLDEEDEDEDTEMDLLRMLRQDAEPQDGSRDTTEIELVPESMASYLNRKTALLMLWFPLGVSRNSPGFPVHKMEHDPELTNPVRSPLLHLAHPGRVRFRRRDADRAPSDVEVVRLCPRCPGRPDLRSRRMAVSRKPLLAGASLTPPT